MSGNESIAVAHYDQVTTWPRDELQADIVHIGFGAFHRGIADAHDLSEDVPQPPAGF